MADRAPLPRDPEEERADLLATIKAARDLGPEMDASVVDSYLERRRSEARAGVVPSGTARQGGQQGIVAQQTPGMPTGLPLALGMLFPLAGIAVYIVLLVTSGGNLWWLFWLPMVMGGMWRGMMYPHARYAYRDERRARREEYRAARREAREHYWSDRYGERYSGDGRRRDDELD